MSRTVPLNLLVLTSLIRTVSKSKHPASCLRCPNLTTDRRHKYCSNKCQLLAQRENYLSKWFRGEVSGNTGSGRNLQVSTIVRAYMYEKAYYQCSICSWNKIHPVTGTVPLTVDHKNGNPRDSRAENLRVLCPNCHSLTETYGNLNRGRGRSLGL